jgi:hypothetical protein
VVQGHDVEAERGAGYPALGLENRVHGCPSETGKMVRLRTEV